MECGVTELSGESLCVGYVCTCGWVDRGFPVNKHQAGEHRVLARNLISFCDPCDRAINADYVTVSLKPANVCAPIKSRISVASPNGGFSPMDIALMTVFISASEIVLRPKPELVSMKKLESTLDVIEDAIVSRFVQVVKVEEAAKEHMVA